MSLNLESNAVPAAVKSHLNGRGHKEIGRSLPHMPTLMDIE